MSPVPPSDTESAAGPGLAALFIGTRSTGKGRAPGGAWLSASGQVSATDEIDTSAVAVCPGDGLAVQVGTQDGDDGDAVFVRDLRTLEVVEQFPVAAGVDAAVVACGDKDASAITLIDHSGAYDARAGTQLVPLEWDPGRPIEASGRVVLGQSYEPDIDEYTLEALHLDRGSRTPVVSGNFEYALGPDGERLAALRYGRARHQLRIFDLTSIRTEGVASEAAEIGRRQLPQGFFMAVSADEALGAPLYLAWVDADRLAYVRGEQPDVTKRDLGRVTVIDGTDLSTLCMWRGWNVAPVATADGVLLGAGGGFRSARRPPGDRASQMIVFELRRRPDGRAITERWRIAGSIAGRGASGSPAATFRVPGAEPTGLVVPLSGFDALALFGERSSGCGATSKEVATDDAPFSRRELEDALLARVAPIGCRRWRGKDEPFEFGASAAVQCDRPGLGVDQLALFRFPDTRSLERFWTARKRQLDLRQRPRACAGTTGSADWEQGEVACYEAPRTNQPKIRWIDRSEGTYGVLDFSSTHWDVGTIHRWWRDNLLPAATGPTAADEDAPAAATSRPRAPAQDRPFDAWVFTDEDPSGGGGNATWRDRADDEDGYRVYARRTWTTPGCDERRGPLRRIDRLPADTQRYRPDHRAVLRELPEPRDVWTDQQGRVPVAYEILVAAFNEAGESRRVKAAGYSWGLFQCGFDV